MLAGTWEVSHDPRRRSALRYALGGVSTWAGFALGGCSVVVRDSSPSPWPDRPFLLLGEVHDHPEHHQLRAAGLRRWLADGLPTTVLFEQMERSRDAAIRAAVAAAGAVPQEGPQLSALADRVAEAGGLSSAGWAWPLHRPMVEACLAGKAQLGGANLSLAEVRAIVRQGLVAAPADVRAAIEADRLWSPGRQASLERLIDEGHCKMLPADRWPAMALAQRARDAAMALAMRAAASENGANRRVVLMAGNGHVRRDLGVPQALMALGTPAEVLHAVAYLEETAVTAEDTRYYDQVVLTRPWARPDPCEAFRQRSAPPRPS